MSRELVTTHLLKRGSIDEIDAARYYGVFSLSRVISRVRKDGHRIKASSVTRKMRLATGETVEKTFGLYTLQEAKKCESVVLHSSSCLKGMCRLFIDTSGGGGAVVEFDWQEDTRVTAQKLRKLADQLEAL